MESTIQRPQIGYAFEEVTQGLSFPIRGGSGDSSNTASEELRTRRRHQKSRRGCLTCKFVQDWFPILENGGSLVHTENDASNVTRQDQDAIVARNLTCLVMGTSTKNYPSGLAPWPPSRTNRRQSVLLSPEL